MNVIFGAAGFAKEIDFLLADNDPNYKTDYYVGLENIGDVIFESSIISEDEFFEMNNASPGKTINAYIGIGSPAIREKIFSKLISHSNISFPTIIHHSVIYDKRNKALSFGKGNVICAGTILTTNITIGQQNHLNLDVTVGHDTSIGNFNTVSPGVHISGNVQIGNNVFVGTGAVILEKISIADNVVIGAGAIVTKSLMEAGTYVGAPAKRIK